MLSSKAHVGICRVQGVVENPLRVRLRLDQLLNSVDFRPAGLPPAAIFMVRRLHDPLPGHLTSSPTAVRVGIRWETAVREQLGRLVRQAVRPVAGRLPAQAEALLFRDEAEMLACLLLAIHQGEAHHRWWWQRLLRRFPQSKLVTILSQQPQEAPAVWHHLGEWQQAIPLVSRLTAGEISTIYQSLTAVWPLPEMPQLHTETETPKTPLVRQSPFLQTGAAARSPTAAWETLEAPAEPGSAIWQCWAPWLDWVSPAEVPLQGLSRAQALLLGVNLTLQRRPAAVTGHDFRQQLEQWWLAQESAGLQPPDFLPSEPNARNQAMTAFPSADQPNEATVATEWQAMQTTTSIEPPPPVASAGLVVKQAAAQAVDNTADTTAVGVVTRLAGVFYLINAMLRLKLLELFEAEWQLTSRIGAWGLLELLARGLLVDSPEELTNDPLWAALASLNNRQPDEPPGRGYSTTGVLALPSGFATFEEVDVSAARLAASPFLKDVVPDLISWLNLVLPTIMVSLCQAMQQQTLTTFSEIAKGVLRYDGHLIVTAAHVDLIFDLDDISLPLRLAGLDTDPGWLPAFGRVIRFHFE